MLHTNLTLSKKGNSGKCNLDEQDYTASIQKYKVNTASLVNNAEDLGSTIPKKDYFGWFQSMISPTGGASATNSGRSCSLNSVIT